MLRSIESFLDFNAVAKDGEIGKVDNVFFDDEKWLVRYLVIRTDNWLNRKKVLIPTNALGRPDWKGSYVPLSLTKEQIKNSPSIDVDQPVSRQHEVDLLTHYGWGPYWVGSGALAGGVPGPERPPSLRRGADAQELEEVSHSEKQHGDPHLRSYREVDGYHIQASDDAVGHLEELIIDDESWHVRYAVVNTRNWLSGRKVLISPGWITRVSWAERKVFVDLDRESIKNSPEYNPDEPVNREYEEVLYDYYGRPKYWP
jgi:sporulation protein YlmC with PRC-barrel domain